MAYRTYEALLSRVLHEGTPKGDRTGTGTRSLFGEQLRFDLSQGFPLVTTKKVHFPSVVGELLWFLSGSTYIKTLREKYGVAIWDEWADEDDSIGPMYGEQWRFWPENAHCADCAGEGIDQIANVIESIKTDPDSRRHIVSAWNVADLPDMALAPCHVLFQFYVANGKLSCQLYQRSADMFLGVPFNIASYALLTHMVAAQTGYEVGEFIWTGGDVHLYENHIEQAKEQLSRRPYPMPQIKLRPVESIFDYTPEDIILLNYNHRPTIKAPVAV